ncbi:hypothetical protein OUZ56_015406 [Daphnia magna]|uniref:PSMD12/CSN4-like N-terminal domain-containing protein n=1 Tax=Daphnia magna TaxID=35525 RepID=A0ABR0AMR1_9CRUS|nr:hypothetical protein OUZ56_015406 [Daphnia magna]
MEKLENVELILEQMKLFLAKKDFTCTLIIYKIISEKVVDEIPKFKELLQFALQPIVNVRPRRNFPYVNFIVADSDCNYGLLSPCLSRAAFLVHRSKNHDLQKLPAVGVGAPST